MSKAIVISGIPSAAGSFTDTASRSAAAIRAAGLLSALESRGLEVKSRPDLPAFPFGDDPAHPTCRNAAVVAEAIRAASRRGGRRRPLGAWCWRLGGDCSLLPRGRGRGAAPRRSGPVGLIFLDAHGDLNTPHTTPSGRVAGMALALALGHGDAGLLAAAGPVPAGRAAADRAARVSRPRPRGAPDWSRRGPGAGAQ